MRPKCLHVLQNLHRCARGHLVYIFVLLSVAGLLSGCDLGSHQEQVERTATREQPTEDPRPCAGGREVQDESKGVIAVAGEYVFKALQRDMTLSLANRSDVKLPHNQAIRVRLPAGITYEVHGWFDAGSACLWDAESAPESGKLAFAPRNDQFRSTTTAGQRSTDAANRTPRGWATECFRARDGNWAELEAEIRKSAHDPDSMETVETRFDEEDDLSDGTLYVQLRFRANNAFGAKVLSTAWGEMNQDCSVRSWGVFE